jgi:selenocysteine lyase/cysteine desulfurase
MYPWMNVAQRYGVKLLPVAEETDPAGRKAVPLDQLLDAIAQPNVRLVALSHVEFGSGQRHDLAPIGSLCRQKGITFLVDAIQSLGAVPVDVKAMQIDYLACGGQKWLLAPEGTGIFYCRKEFLPTTRPLTIGATNVVNAMDFVNYNFTLRPDAGRFESGGQNIPGLLALRQSLNLLLSAGKDAVADRIKSIGDRLIAALESKGYTTASPRQADQWSGIISVSPPPGSSEKLDDTVTRLRNDHHIEIAARHGRLRIAPHFYNTDEQMDRLVELLPR